jgi:hypothetical protein
MYPYRLQDLAVLQSVQQVLEKNIQFVCDGYDDEIATDEATELDDEEAMKRFLEGDK